MQQFWLRSKRVLPLGIWILNRWKKWCWRIWGRWIGHPGWAWGDQVQLEKTHWRTDLPMHTHRAGGMIGILCDGERTFSLAHAINQLQYKKKPKTPPKKQTNIPSRESSVRHICTKCFQKDGAEHSHPDTSPSCPHRLWQLNTHKPMHRSTPPPGWHVNRKQWMFRTRLNISRQWPRGGTCWWMGCLSKMWIWDQVGAWVPWI